MGSIHFRFRARQLSSPKLACAASPDFLSRLVALANFMRLSLRKAAYAAMSSAAWQEIRVRLVNFIEGEMQATTATKGR